MAQAKISMTSQAEAEQLYLRVGRNSSYVQTVRLFGKVVTIECAQMSEILHVVNQYCGTVRAGFVRQIIIKTGE